MNAPVVSVIIPTYNRGHVLQRAIASALSQSFQELEVVVVDDGSSDDTKTVIGSITDSRLKCIGLPHNIGMTPARNVGIRAARGEYVAFLDSDDEWHRDKLSVQLKRFKENPHNLQQLGAVLGVTEDRRDPDFVLLSSVDRHWDGWISGLIWKYPRHEWSTMLVKRRHLDEVGGFDARLKASDFWDLSHRLAKVCQFDATSEARSIIHHEPGPRAWNLVNRASAANILLAKHSFRGRYGRKAKAGFHVSVARYQATQKHLPGSLVSMARAITTYPDARFALTTANLFRRRYTGDAAVRVKTR